VLLGVKVAVGEGVLVGVLDGVGVFVMGVKVKVAVDVCEGVIVADGVIVAVADAVGELPPNTLGAVTSMDTLKRMVRELVATISFTVKGTSLGTSGT
jgi:hypothetical protein